MYCACEEMLPSNKKPKLSADSSSPLLQHDAHTVTRAEENYGKSEAELSQMEEEDEQIQCSMPFYLDHMFGMSVGSSHKSTRIHHTTIPSTPMSFSRDSSKQTSTSPNVPILDSQGFLSATVVNNTAISPIHRPHDEKHDQSLINLASLPLIENSLSMETRPTHCLDNDAGSPIDGPIVSHEPTHSPLLFPSPEHSDIKLGDDDDERLNNKLNSNIEQSVASNTPLSSESCKPGNTRTIPDQTKSVLVKNTTPKTSRKRKRSLGHLKSGGGYECPPGVTTLKDCSIKQTTVTLFALVIQVHPVMEVACRVGDMAGRTVPMSSLLLGDPTKSFFKLSLWRQAAVWAERISAGDIVYFKKIRIKVWKNEVVGTTTMYSSVLNLHQPKKTLPPHVIHDIPAVSLDGLMTWAKQFYTYLFEGMTSIPKSQRSVVFVSSDDLSSHSLVHYRARLLSIITAKVLVITDTPGREAYLYLINMDSSLWLSQLHSGIGRVWEFTFLAVSADTATQGGCCSLQTTSRSQLRVLAKDCDMSIEILKLFPHDDTYTGVVTKGLTIAQILLGKSSGFFQFKARATSLQFTDVAETDLEHFSSLPPSAMVQELCQKSLYVGCECCSKPLSQDENGVFCQCMSCLLSKPRGSTSFLYYFRPIGVTLEDDSGTVSVVATRTVSPKVLGIEPLKIVQTSLAQGKSKVNVTGYIATAHHLHECVREGLVDHIGLTNFDTESTKEIVSSGVPIATTQVQYSLLDRRPLTSGLVSLCLTHDIKILAYGVLAGGFLSDRWLNTARPEAESLSNRSLYKYLLVIDEFGGWGLFQKLLQTLRVIADRHKVTGEPVSVAMVAIQYVLSQEAVGGVIIGSHSSRHLESTVASTGLTLLPEDLSEIECVLAQASGPIGGVFELERDVLGKHGQIMKYNLSQVNAGDHLDELCHRYLQLQFSAHPVEATRTGYRLPPPNTSSKPGTTDFDDYPLLATKTTSYDHSLDIASTRDIEKICRHIAIFLEEIKSIDQSKLSKDQLVDLDIMLSQLNLELLNYHRVQSHNKDPLFYLPLNAVLYLLPVWGDEGDTGSRLKDSTHPGVADMTVGHRLSALLSRLQSIPKVLLSAHKNLTSPAKVFVETAIDICGSFGSFLANDVTPLCVSMAAADESSHKEVIAEIKLAATVASECINKFNQYLSEDLLPNSSTVTGVGKEVYKELLKYSHFMEDSDELVRLGEQHFQSVKKELEALAKEIDPSKSWQEITKTLINPLHPRADNLLASYMTEIQRAKDHMISRDLVSSLPPDEQVRGFTTPKFLVPFSPVGDYLNPSPFAGMGSLQTQPSHRVGHLMLHSIADRNLSPTEERDLLRGHDYSWISVVSPHESYPGHHIQALLAQTHSRVLRKYHESVLFYEGWGLYTEELAFETGFFSKDLEYCVEGSDNVRTLPAEQFGRLTRLTQLRLQLWRAARVILDAKLNLGEMTVEECREFLHREVMFNEGASVGEVFMYVSRPGYAPCYVAGFVMLMKLREDMKRKCLENGQTFCLRDFHDSVLSKGCIPFKLLHTLL